MKKKMILNGLEAGVHLIQRNTLMMVRMPLFYIL